MSAKKPPPARVFYDQHPLYLVGPLGRFKIGERVTIPPGGHRERALPQTAEVIREAPGTWAGTDGMMVARVACESCGGFHAGPDCE